MTDCLQADGSYAGFDPAEFPSRSGGKRDAVQHIKTVSRAEAPGGAGGMPVSPPRCTHLSVLDPACPAPHRPSLPPPPTALPPLPHLQTHGFQTVVMVGDGMTDFEARAPGGADAFIGCGACKSLQLPPLHVLPISPMARGSSQHTLLPLCTGADVTAAHALPARRYGGVVYRENVAKLSDWYTFDITAITNCLTQQ